MTALKTLTLRLTKTKTELEGLGEDGEYAAESISELRDEVKAYTGVDIMDGDAYKSTYDILVEIAKVWDDINNQDQQALLYMLGGARQANVIASIINNIDEVEAAAQTASNSTGSALKENETYLDSIAGKMNQFKAQFQALSTTLVDSDIPKFFIDMGTGALSFFDVINKTIGVLPTFASLLSGILSASGKKAGILTPIIIDEKDKKLIFQLAEIKKRFSEKGTVKPGTMLFGEDLSLVSEYINALNSGAVADFDNKQKSLSQSFKDYLSTLNGATPSMNGYVKSLIKGKAATLGLKAASVLLNAGLTLLASVAIQAVISGLDYLIHYDEKLLEKSQELQDEYVAESDKLEDINTQLEENRKRIDELESKGSLTYVDQQELSNLQAATEELEYQLTIQERMAKIAGKKAEEAAMDVVDSKSEEKTIYNDNGENIGTLSVTRAEKIQLDIDEASKIKQQIDELQKEYADAVANNFKGKDYYYRDAGGYSQRIKNLEKNYNDLINEATTLQSELDEQLPSFVGATEASEKYRQAIIASGDAIAAFLNNDAEQLTEKFDEMWDGFDDNKIKSGLVSLARNGELVAETFNDPAYSDFKSKLDEIGIGAEEAAQHLNATYSTADRLKNLTQSFETVKNSANATTEAIATVDDILTKQTAGVGITIDEYEKLVDINGDYASALEYVNGNMQINAEKAQAIADLDLQDTLVKTKAALKANGDEYRRNATEIAAKTRELSNLDDMTSEYAQSLAGEISSLQAENDAISEASSGYMVLIQSLNEANSAYSKWKNLQDSADPGAMYDDVLTGIEKFDEIFANGRIGNKAEYQALVDFIIPDTVDAEDEAEVKEYIKKLSRYFSFDEDGNKTFSGMNNFLEDAVDKNLFLKDELGNYQVAQGVSMSKIADDMNLTIDVVRAFFGELEAWGAEFDWADELLATLQITDEEIKSMSEDIQKDIDAINSKPIKTEIDIANLLEYEAELFDIQHLQDGLNNVSDNRIKAFAEIQSKLSDAEDRLRSAEMSGDAQSIADIKLEIAQYKDELASIPEIKDTTINVAIAEAEANIAQIKSDLNVMENGTAEGKAIIRAELQVDTDEQAVAVLKDQLSANNEFISTVKLIPDSQDVENTTTEIDGQEHEIQYQIDGDPSRLNSILKSIEARQLPTLYYTIQGKEAGVSKTSSSGKKGVGANALGTQFPIATSQKSLVGELGQEMVVEPQTGRWYTVGNHGAEFVQLSKGSIVFNHRQTQELLKNGSTHSRGLALANGNAYGRAFVRGSSFKPSNSATASMNNTYYYGSSKAQERAAKAQADANEAAKKQAEETKQIYEEQKRVLEEQKDILDDQKDIYDSVIRAVQKRLDKEIEALEKEKDALSDPDIAGSYGDRINQIQMQIDALNKLRETQDRINAVEKAKAEVERLKRQKTMRIYREGQGFVWESDQTALEQAQADLEEAELDKQLADLEEAKEKLEDMLEEEEAALDENIEKLEEYKDQWGEVADAYQDEQDRLHASQILGQNWEAEILAGRLDTLTTFRDLYIQLMSEIAAKVEEIEALEKRISEATARINSLSSTGGGGGSGGGVSGSGSSGGSSPSTNYGIYNSVNGKLIRRSGTYAQAEKDYNEMKSMGVPIHIGTYAKGTLSAPGGIGIVDDQFSGKRGEELIIRPSRGRATMLEKGDGVLPARETMNLMSMAQNPVEFIKKALNSAMRSGISLPSIQSLSKSYHFSFGEIVMQGVNDPNTFAQVLIREFPSAIKQELSK